jgi:hypothetical protein
VRESRVGYIANCLHKYSTPGKFSALADYLDAVISTCITGRIAVGAGATTTNPTTPCNNPLSTTRESTRFHFGMAASPSASIVLAATPSTNAITTYRR